MENQFCRVLKTSEMWFLCMSFLNPSMFVFKGGKNCCTVRTSENCDQKILHHLLKWSNQWPEGKFSPLCSTCTRSGNFVNSGKNFTKSPRKWKSRENENDMPNFTHRLSYKIPLRMRPCELQHFFQDLWIVLGKLDFLVVLKIIPKAFSSALS